MSKKDDSHIVCKECHGNGFIRGTLGNTGTCIFCHGQGYKYNGTFNNNQMITLVKLCGDYVNDKFKGDKQ